MLLFLLLGGQLLVVNVSLGPALILLAHRTFGVGLLRHIAIATVETAPDYGLRLLVQGSAGQLAVGLLEYIVMQALNGGDLFKQTGYVLEALPFGQLSKGGVGGGELLQLAGCGEGQIWAVLPRGKG